MDRILIAALLLTSCAEPGVALPPAVPTTAIASIRAIPEHPDGRTAAIARFELTLTGALEDHRVIALAGGASSDDVAAYAKGRTTSALRAREIATTSWLAGGQLVVQPVRALPAGRNTLMILQDKRAPLTTELDVVPLDRVATRVWTSATSVTHCAPLDTSSRTLTLAPSEIPARVVPRGPCFDIVTEGAIASLVLPPALGALALDPAPIGAPEPAPPRGDPPCPESAYPLGPLCVRVDDDRLVLVGGAETKRLIMGAFGPFAIGAVLPAGARTVVRGFPPGARVPIDIVVRDALGDLRVTQTLVTRPRRRHAVINEVLARPLSGAASQRYLEIVNDGDVPLDLRAIVLRDGDDEWPLPDTILAPGTFALITPEGYVDGLAGEPAPPKGVPRVRVESLRLTGEVALVESDGNVLSRFPPTTSTRLAARARRTPETPDDAPEAFAFATPTPGRANVIPP